MQTAHQAHKKPWMASRTAEQASAAALDTTRRVNPRTAMRPPPRAAAASQGSAIQGMRRPGGRSHKPWADQFPPPRPPMRNRPPRPRATRPSGPHAPNWNTVPAVSAARRRPFVFDMMGDSQARKMLETIHLRRAKTGEGRHSCLLVAHRDTDGDQLPTGNTVDAVQQSYLPVSAERAASAEADHTAEPAVVNSGVLPHLQSHRSRATRELRRSDPPAATFLDSTLILPAGVGNL
jgi:hypothetical protein